MSELEHQPQEHPLFLTIDFAGDFPELFHLTRDFGDSVKAVKLGQGFLLDERAWRIQKYLMKNDVTVFLDAKYHEDRDQMDYDVKKSFEQGISMVSVAPSTSFESLIAAGNAQTDDHRVVAAFSTSGRRLLHGEVRNVQRANRELAPGKKITEVMANAVNARRVRRKLGSVTVNATGIRMPGDDPHDQPYVMTPAEALYCGADRLVIGRAITAKRDKRQAYQEILENIATYR